jgi:hypothetical protein
MSNKRPQPTGVLISRLQRVARYHERIVNDALEGHHPADLARANTCWQAAARLEELLAAYRRLTGQTEIES